MPDTIIHAQPPLEFIPPRFNPLVWQTSRTFLPLWVRWRAQITEIQVSHAERLVELYRQFQAGDVRFMLAFRHPSTSDPLCLGHLLWHHIPQVAKQQGVQLKQPTHAHFIYDRGIPLWAGQQVGWFYSHLGGTPIRRGKVDLAGLRSVRDLFANGGFPMAAAPEGATNGHNEIVAPIEPGIAQFGFWCIEDLQKASRSERVVIVPLGIQYHFVDSPWVALEALLSQLEADSGLSHEEIGSGVTSQEGRLFLGAAGGVPTPEQELVLYKRLFRLGEHLLFLMEEFYRKFYHQELPARATRKADEFAGAAGRIGNKELAERLQALLNAALLVAEQYFGVPPKGSLTDRCRRLEQAGWDWIYREDVKAIETLSPVERGLADRVAEEANLRIWHMRLVETFVSVTGRYVIEKPTVNRFADMLLLLWDTATRIKGKTPFPRPHLGKRCVQMTIGEPISVSDRWEEYQGNRRRAVANLTQDLQSALEQMIDT